MNEFFLYSSFLWELPGFQKPRGASGLPHLFPGSPPVDIIFECQLCQAVAKVLPSPPPPPAPRRPEWEVPQPSGRGSFQFPFPHLQGCGPRSAGLSPPPRRLRGSAAPPTACDPTRPQPRGHLLEGGGSPRSSRSRLPNDALVLSRWASVETL